MRRIFAALMGDLIEIFFTGMTIYFLYKLVVDLIMPVSKATTNVRSNIKKMQEMQEEQLRKQKATNASTQSATVKKSPDREGDYIDFEEVK